MAYTQALERPAQPAHTTTIIAHSLCLDSSDPQLDFVRLYDSMVKPAFIFDGRNILDHAVLRDQGFVVYALGKPLDPFLKKD